MRNFIALLVALVVTVGVSVSAFGQVGGLGFPGPGPPHSAAPTNVTWSYKTSATGGGGGTSATFSGVAIGATVSSDIIVLIVGADVGIPTSMTITDSGGTPRSATSPGQDNSGVNNFSIWYLSGFTLGATSTVVINASGGSLFNSAFNVGVISGSSHPTPTFVSTAASFSDPTSISGTIPTGGIGIVGLAMGTNPAGTWTNATQETGQPVNPSEFQWMAHTANGTGATITPTYGATGSNQSHLIMGIWGP
jgi:hypothetical protein